MTEEEKEKIKSLFHEYDKAADEAWQERVKYIEETKAPEARRDGMRFTRIDQRWRCFRQMSDSIRNRFPEIWEEANSEAVV